MTEKNSLVTNPIDYVITRGTPIIKKMICRSRLKKIFIKSDCMSLWRWFISSYNSCIISDMNDKRIYELICAGILIIVNDGDHNYSSYDVMRRIRMNPSLFASIIL